MPCFLRVRLGPGRVWDSDLGVCDFEYGSSDPLTQGLPEWELQPLPNYYVVKSHPAVITCRATPAIRISFRCAGRQVPAKSQTNREMVDSRTRRKTLESTIQVTKEEVSDYFGSEGFVCECFAYNNVQGSSTPGTVKSKKGLVEVANLKKRFRRVPLAVRVKENVQTEMVCLPPEGKPRPTVSH
ncbi:netrin receptor unc-5 [Elysia marginata]|uniref:Netrin receptor unc-5 n=1 Tax=Elysia marginata TaxID=1093978 RepID=A0AAV4GGJ4_9GAST|nr:netrin receptor unc-5 [Elysia marginata]